MPGAVPHVGFVAVLLAACAGTPDHRAIVTGVVPPAPAPSSWVVGVARNARLGAVVWTGEHAVYCDGVDAWPREVEGRPIVVAGALTARTSAAATAGPDGERAAGAEGTAWALAGCTRPPGHADGELIAVEHALFAAIAQRDQQRLARLAAPELVLRMPDQADVDRAGLLRSVAGIPGDILEVTGEGVRAHRAGDTGIVEGVQVARVRVDGNVIEDRGSFVDVFVRRAGAWQLVFALNVPLAAAGAR